MGYTKNAISGFSWQTIQKGATLAIAALKIMVLARLLSPDDFGLFSLTAIALGLTESMTQTGVNFTILQSKQSINYFLDTAWVISIFRGFIIAIIMILMGLGMSKYFDEPQLLTLIGVAALVPMLKGFINPAIVSLHKNMNFFKDSTYRFSLVIVEAIFAISFALILHSVWALVFSLIARAIFEVMVSFVFFRTRPRFHYISSRGKAIFANAKWLGIATIFNYLNENMDDLLIGSISGLNSLGLYHNAYALSHKPNYEVAKSIHHGTIPIYTKIVDKQKRLTRAFSKSFFVALAITITASLPLLLFPEPFVKILLGNQWLEIIPLIRPLTIAGIIQAISMTSYSLFLAKKDSRMLNSHLFLNLVIMVIAVTVLGSSHGLYGAVIGILISRVIALPLVLYGIYRNI